MSSLSALVYTVHPTVRRGSSTTDIIDSFTIEFVDNFFHLANMLSLDSGTVFGSLDN